MENDEKPGREILCLETMSFFAETVHTYIISHLTVIVTGVIDSILNYKTGTRAPVTDYERCNLGKVKANALVVRGGANYDDSKTKAIINLFLYAQQYYGRKDEDDFKYAYIPSFGMQFEDIFNESR
jgi:hypothetical protein